METRQPTVFGSNVAPGQPSANRGTVGPHLAGDPPHGKLNNISQQPGTVVSRNAVNAHVQVVGQGVSALSYGVHGAAQPSTSQLSSPARPSLHLSAFKAWPTAVRACRIHSSPAYAATSCSTTTTTRPARSAARQACMAARGRSCMTQSGSDVVHVACHDGTNGAPQPLLER